MFDFSDIRAAGKEEQIRSWCVEQAIDHLRGVDVPMQGVITLSKMIEDYVVNGDVNGSISAAVEEGYSEGRFQVKEAVEEMLQNLPRTQTVDLNALFRSRGWMLGKGSD